MYIFMDTPLPVSFPNNKNGLITMQLEKVTDRASCILAEGAEEIQTSDAAGGKVWQSRLVRIA